MHLPLRNRFLASKLNRCASKHQPWAFRRSVRNHSHPSQTWPSALNARDFPKSLGNSPLTWGSLRFLAFPFRADRRFPFAVLGPVECPPCSLHRPERYRSRRLQAVPARVFAPQARSARIDGKSPPSSHHRRQRALLCSSSNGTGLFPEFILMGVAFSTPSMDSLDIPLVH